MRVTKKDDIKRTEILKYVLQHSVPNSPGNHTLTLTLLQRSGGEMYGM